MSEEITNRSKTVYTIGFTKKTAEQFFELLRKNGVKKIIDTRLNNESQLAGFSKKDDLKYFLKSILNIEYVHKPELAPTEDILKTYKKKNMTWNEYEKKYVQLISDRQIEDKITPEELDQACLLCSEAEPKHCHRRLLAEYLQQKYPRLTIRHI